MPIYQCATIGVPLEEDQMKELAEGITEIHSSETGAPEPFIRVVFTPLPQSLGYTAGAQAPSVIINGGIRSGRSDIARHKIMHRLHALARDVTGVPDGQIVISTTDHPAQNLMEAGLIMPQANPEDEAAWFDRLEEAGSIAESRVGAEA